MLHSRILLPIAALLVCELPAAEPLMLTRHRQLFVDDRLIASSSKLKRVIHAAQKYEDNPILLPVKPWEGQYTLLYGTVIRDEEEGIWKMWYSTVNHFRYIQKIFPESTYLCYATSRDGLRWTKPDLGIISYRGNKQNNIVLEGTHAPELGIEGILDAVSILKDAKDPDPAKRYKLMVWRHNQKFEGGKSAYVLEGPYRMGHYVAFSPDGIRWSRPEHLAFPYLPVRDTMSLMWDPRTSKYIAFVKQQVDGKRARFVSESDDFLTWSSPNQILVADDRDPRNVELYHNTGFPYEGMYLGLLTVFHPEPLDNIYLDLQLISSRDGRTWERVGDRSPFLPVGRRDIDWDYGFHSPSSGPPIRVEDELWFYYSGRAYRHPVDGQGREPNKGAIGLAKLRLDGFVSMDARDEDGTLTTVPLRFSDAGLYINADAKRGRLRVEILDEAGLPIEGFRENNGIEFTGDKVRWRAADLSALRGRTIRIKFYLRNASLYSFGFDAI
jgi:hypothetical protein